MSGPLSSIQPCWKAWKWRGSKLISSGVCPDIAFVAGANVKLSLAPRVRFGCQLLAPQQTSLRHLFRCCFLLIGRVPCLLIFPTSHQNTMPQMCHLQRCPPAFWSHEPLNSCCYTFLILYSTVNAEGHVTRQLCDRNRVRGSLCLQHCFCYDVTPDVGLYSRGRHGAKKGVDQTRDRKMLIGSSLLLHRWKSSTAPKSNVASRRNRKLFDSSAGKLSPTDALNLICPFLHKPHNLQSVNKMPCVFFWIIPGYQNFMLSKQHKKCVS